MVSQQFPTTGSNQTFPALKAVKNIFVHVEYL